MNKSLFGFFIYSYAVVSLSSATVSLKPFTVSFADLPAKFAVDVNGSGICGALYVADPLDGCSFIRNVFEADEINQIKFALIIRGVCTFEDKIVNAQNAGFHAAIVYDDRDRENLVYMMVNPVGIKLHAVFVSKQAGEFLKMNAKGKSGECCILHPFNGGGAWTVLAISFLSIIVIVALLTIAFVTPRRWLHWPGRPDQRQPRSLDTKIVETLPCFTFSSARCSSQCRGRETCAICLEDYKDGDVLKVLPCKHEFHSSCVDSWLTKWGTVCPVCKLDMRTNNARSEVKSGNRS